MIASSAISTGETLFEIPRRLLLTHETSSISDLLDRGTVNYITKRLHTLLYNTYASYANDTRTRNRYRKSVPENLYRFSAGVSCESV